ncbi:MAG TPA: hypothetical protein VKN36_08210 [Eudoraea sp.]|nr:hypothetical protein [Eudoraea sp.]
MKKSYTLTIFLNFFSAVLFLLPASLFSQQPKVFTIEDFELSGMVKSCLVITDYGREEFEFNMDGYLTKLVTRYNEDDYDVTYYKYQGSDLAERRFETYRDGTFDKNTSIAHVYQTDTLGPKKITEKILSYNEIFLEKYEYQFDVDGQLVKIIRTNDEGLDETTVMYTNYQEENTVTYYLNGVMQKSIRRSARKQKNGSSREIELTKNFLEGEPVTAIERIYGTTGHLISEQHFEYDTAANSFVPAEKNNYEYDDKGRLVAQKTKLGPMEKKKAYIYQFDNEETGNWIKKIVTPENTYTTRRIQYYDIADEVEEQ